MLDFTKNVKWFAVYARRIICNIIIYLFFFFCRPWMKTLFFFCYKSMLVSSNFSFSFLSFSLFDDANQKKNKTKIILYLSTTFLVFMSIRLINQMDESSVDRWTDLLIIFFLFSNVNFSFHGWFYLSAKWFIYWRTKEIEHIWGKKNVKFLSQYVT